MRRVILCWYSICFGAHVQCEAPWYIKGLKSVSCEKIESFYVVVFLLFSWREDWSRVFVPWWNQSEMKMVCKYKNVNMQYKIHAGLYALGHYEFYWESWKTNGLKSVHFSTVFISNETIHNNFETIGLISHYYDTLI